MKILVTAFEPFGDNTENPTEQIIRELKTEPEVTTLRLSVSFNYAPVLVIEEILRSQPDAVIMLGQAGGRASVCLERVAINIADATSADNYGVQPDEEQIIPGAPAAYLCPLPLKPMRRAVREAGVPCHISNSAGTFVCNALYYRVLHRFPKLPAVFVHVPYSTSQALSKPIATPSMGIATMTGAVKAIILHLRRGLVLR